MCFPNICVCVGSCCEGLCSCCRSAFGASIKAYSRLAYVMLQLVCVLVAFVMMFTLQKIEFLECVNESGEQDNDCFGVSAIFRMTFALFFFHLAIALMIAPMGRCSSFVHDAGWMCKFLLIIGLFIAFFWVNIGVFKVWGEISRYVSILFLIFEVIYLTEFFAYKMNNWLVPHEHQPEDVKNYKYNMLCGMMLLCNGISITLWVLSYTFFLGTAETDGAAGCGSHMTILIIG